MPDCQCSNEFKYTKNVSFTNASKDKLSYQQRECLHCCFPIRICLTISQYSFFNHAWHMVILCSEKLISQPRELVGIFTERWNGASCSWIESTCTALRKCSNPGQPLKAGEFLNDCFENEIFQKYYHLNFGSFIKFQLPRISRTF